MPNTRTVPIDLGFQVADAEDVRVHFEQQSLILTFTDWNEKTVWLACADAVAFRWQEAEYLIDSAERNDSIYKIEDSPWLALHRNQGCLLNPNLSTITK